MKASTLVLVYDRQGDIQFVFGTQNSELELGKGQYRNGSMALGV